MAAELFSSRLPPHFQSLSRELTRHKRGRLVRLSRQMKRLEIRLFSNTGQRGKMLHSAAGAIPGKAVCFQ